MGHSLARLIDLFYRSMVLVRKKEHALWRNFHGLFSGSALAHVDCCQAKRDRHLDGVSCVV